MKKNWQATVIILILSIVLFFAGQYIWSSFFELILPTVGKVKYISTDLAIPFRNAMLPGLALALIPAAAIIIWRCAPVFGTQRKIYSVCIIVIAMTAAVFARREMIKYQATRLQPETASVLKSSDPYSIQTVPIESGIPLSTLNFELFAFGGLLAGSVISIFLLKKKNNKFPSPNVVFNLLTITFHKSSTRRPAS